MNDFISKMLYEYAGDERKPKGKNSRLVALPSPFHDIEADRERRKEAGPTLSGRGIWSNREEKERAGSGAVRTGRVNLFWWSSKIFKRGGLE